MIDSHKIYLHDRIKETSYTMGIGDFLLDGPARGFESFGTVYSNGDNVFYAITDGNFYEVGSGVYHTNGVQNTLTRFPFRSNNSNNLVNFPEGLKEVFVTYPATNSVYTASGLQNNIPPRQSGIAFWLSSNIINYDSNIVWDFNEKKMGIRNSAPSFSIDIGGDGAESIIRASGFIVSSSGIIFPSGNDGSNSYAGGIQLRHYESNVVDSDSGLDHVIELSGIANNNFILKKQNAGLIFAGPVSGCSPPCSPDYPTFRPLFLQDIIDVNTTNQVDNSMLVYNSGDSSWDANSRITFSDDILKLDCLGNGATNQGFHVVANSGVGNIRSNSFYEGDQPPRLIFRRSGGRQEDPTSVGIGSGLFAIRSETYDTNGDIFIMGGLRMEIDNDSTVVPGAKIFMRTSSGGPDFDSAINRQLTLYSTGLLENTGDIKADDADFTGLTIRQSNTPASSSAVGASGEIRWDDQYLYICVAPNTWKRTYLTTWG